MAFFVWNENKQEYIETTASYCGPEYLPEPYESLLEERDEWVNSDEMVVPKPLTIGPLPTAVPNWVVFELPKPSTAAPLAVAEEPIVEVKSHQWVAAAWEPTDDKLLDLAREVKADKLQGPLEAAIYRMCVPRSDPRTVYTLMWGLAQHPPTVVKYVEWVLANRPQPTLADLCSAIQRPVPEWPNRRGQQLHALKTLCRGVLPPDFPFDRTVVAGEVRFGMIMQAAERFRRSGPPPAAPSRPPQHRDNQRNDRRPDHPRDNQRNDRRPDHPQSERRGGDQRRPDHPRDNQRNDRRPDHPQNERRGGDQRRPDHPPRDERRGGPPKPPKQDDKKEQRLLPRPPMKK